MVSPFLNLIRLSKRPRETREILTGPLQALMDLDAERGVTSPKKEGVSVRFSQPGTGGPRLSRPTWPLEKDLAGDAILGLLGETSDSDREED